MLRYRSLLCLSLHCLSLLCLTALILSGCASRPLGSLNTTQLINAPVAKATCDVTPPVQDQPADDPNADPFVVGNWHISADRALWVSIPPNGRWHTGGEKAMWIRPAGTALVISGQRLDAAASPLVVNAPCCYPTGFEVNGLHFPTAGCWEISATAGESELRFVIEVLDQDAAEKPVAMEPLMQRGIDPASPLANGLLLQVCNSNTCELRVQDAATGATMEGYAPIPLERFAAVGPSNDLTQLALITYRNNDQLRDGQLKFLDLSTWQVLTTTLTFDEAYDTPLYSADDAHLLIVEQSQAAYDSNLLHLVNVASGELLAEQRLDFYPRNIQFTPDDRAIMIYGTSGTTGAQSHVLLLDATTLEIVWQAQIEGLLNGQVMKEGSTDWLDGFFWQPAAAFALDQPMLYIVHADQERLTTVNFAAQSIDTQATTKPLSWIERLLMLTARPVYAKMANGITKQAMLSPDGTHLYVIGTDQHVEAVTDHENEFVQTSLGLTVIDLASRQISAKVETKAQSITVDPEHGRIFLHGWATGDISSLLTEWTEVLDADTLTSLDFIENQSIAAARRLDGTPILLGTATLANGQTELAILDPVNFEAITLPIERQGGYAGWVVMR